MFIDEDAILKKNWLYYFEMMFFELKTGFCLQEILIPELNVMDLVDGKLNVVQNESIIL